MGQQTLRSEWRTSRLLSSTDTGQTVVVLDVPAATYVARVALVILTAFAGGSPSIDVGDAADADGWIDTTDVTETDTGTYHGLSGDAVYALGKYYAAAGQITATLSGGLTGGSAVVVAECLRISSAVA